VDEMNRLEGKVAVITGGAGGMGRAAAELFTREGARVLIVDRDEAELAGVVADIGGDRIAAFAADVTDPAQAPVYMEMAADRFGGLDIALLNAGITGPNTPLEDYPLEAFDHVMDVNVRGVWLGLKAAIPHMTRRGSGSIVITSSIQGLSAMPGTTGYTTSKHALVGMMKGAALELAQRNIRVNTIHPGFADTPMMQRIHQAASPGAPSAMEAAISATVPMRRYATAEEIALLMLYLASDESGYCTGASYPIDGGILASWAATPG
jgi:NAD(P)-dependent dehydrogenase (short-subunit alcohol dehydrogenase family)